MLSETDWGWWYSYDGENFAGPFSSRDAAVAEASHGVMIPDPFHVMEARKEVVTLAQVITPAAIQEWLGELLAGYRDENGENLPSYDEDGPLVQAILAAVEQNDEPFTPWAFAETRNRELIEVASTPATEGGDLG